VYAFVHYFVRAIKTRQINIYLSSANELTTTMARLCKRQLKLEKQRSVQGFGSSYIREESWSDFHDKHHSDSFRNSSEYLFQNGCGGAQLCEDNANWFFDFLSTLLCGGGSGSNKKSGASSSAWEEDHSESSGDSYGRKRRRRRPQGNIKIDSIVAA